MTITREVTVSEDVDIDLDIDDIYENLTNNEKEELFELLREDRARYNKGYYIEDLIIGKSDSEFLTNKKIWDKIIRLLKYENSELLPYIIEELTYEAPKIWQKEINISYIIIIYKQLNAIIFLAE